MVGFQDEICRLQSIVKSRGKKPVENCDDAKPTFKSLHTGWEKVVFVHNCWFFCETL